MKTYATPPPPPFLEKKPPKNQKKTKKKPTTTETPHVTQVHSSKHVKYFYNTQGTVLLSFFLTILIN